MDRCVRFGLVMFSFIHHCVVLGLVGRDKALNSVATLGQWRGVGCIVFPLFLYFSFVGHGSSLHSAVSSWPSPVVEQQV